MPMGPTSTAPLGQASGAHAAIDAKRNRIYIGTGENLSHPATDTSDAIVALDMDTGELAWRFQALADDAWNAACLNGGANCPHECRRGLRLRRLGHHGQSCRTARNCCWRDRSPAMSTPCLRTPTATTENCCGSVSVSNAAIGPDLAQTTTNGGVHWGMALSGTSLLVAAADPERVRPEYVPKPGLHALDLWQRRGTVASGSDPRLRYRRRRQANDRPAEYARRAKR